MKDNTWTLANGDGSTFNGRGTEGDGSGGGWGARTFGRYAGDGGARQADGGTPDNFDGRGFGGTQTGDEHEG